VSVDGGDPALASLVGRLSQQARRLAGLEMRLARVEMGHKLRRNAVFVALLAMAGVLGVIVIGTAVAVVVAAIALVLPVWAAALIVCGACLLLALPLGLIGARGLARREAYVPEETIESIREDVAWTRRTPS
jgi:hypothetical protein